MKIDKQIKKHLCYNCNGLANIDRIKQSILKAIREKMPKEVITQHRDISEYYSGFDSGSKEMLYDCKSVIKDLLK